MVVDVMRLAVFGGCSRVLSRLLRGVGWWIWVLVLLRLVVKRAVNPCPLNKLPQLF